MRPPAAMGATRIDGNACGAAVEASLTERIAALSTPPHLAVVIVGDDPASHVYVSAKERACARLGIRSTRIDLSADADFSEVTSTVQGLNANPDVNGILVQSPPRPLPINATLISLSDRL